MHPEYEEKFGKVKVLKKLRKEGFEEGETEG